MPERESKTTRTHEFDIVAGKNSYHTEIREGGHKIAEGDARTQEEAQQRASERAKE
jgi:dsRNA-specific ribonuclease